MLKLKKKLSKSQVIKTYANIITMTQMMGKPKYTTPIQANDDKVVYITIEISDVKPPSDDTDEDLNSETAKE